MALRAAAAAGVDVVSLQYQTGCYRMHPSVNLLPLALRRVGVPCVTTFHDFRVPYLFPKAGRLRTSINVFLASTSSRVVLVDPDDVSALPRSVQGRIRLVPIASNIEPNLHVDVERRHTHFSFRLVFFGLANWSKGLDIAVATLRRLRDLSASEPWHLRVVGGGVGTDPSNRTFRAECVALISRLGLEDRVSFAGELQERRVTEELLEADIALLPYRDGVSYRRGSLLACLSHGLPVVTAGPLPEYVPSGWPAFVNGLNLLAFEQPEPEALARTVQGLAGDGDLRATLASGALEFARFFTWERVAKCMDGVLKEAMAERCL
jgi:glycosyltransferase involved in cell wall biosynthesis